MHFKIKVLIFLAIIAFSNCKKDDSFKTAVDLEPLAYLPDSLLCTATKEVPGLGAITWKANCLSAIRENKIILTFITYDDSVELNIRERLSIGRIPQKTGNYTIIPLGNDNIFSNYSTWLADGDVLNAGWDINTLKKNYIDITAIDTITRVFTGKFDVYFKMTNQGIPSSMHSEYINFKNGNFRARYSK
jgi:hypothetical protein